MFPFRERHCCTGSGRRPAARPRAKGALRPPPPGSGGQHFCSNRGHGPRQEHRQTANYMSPPFGGMRT
eukprot:5987348-Lingulodinium_polyedra.AAC.1